MQTHTPGRRFLRLPQVLEKFPVSRSSWYAGVQRGEYPPPVKLTDRCSAWLESDIEALIERKTTEGMR